MKLYTNLFLLQIDLDNLQIELKIYKSQQLWGSCHRLWKRSCLNLIHL